MNKEKQMKYFFRSITASVVLLLFVFVISCNNGGGSGGGKSGGGGGNSGKNSHPSITNLPDTENTYIGTADNFKVNAVDHDDPSNNIAFSISNNQCSFNVLVDPISGTASWTCPLAVEICLAEIKATDDGKNPDNLSDIGALNIQCLDSTSPEILSPAPGTVAAGFAYNYNIVCADEDGDTLTLGEGAGDTCAGALSDNGDGTGTYSFNTDKSQGGTKCQVEITCSDGDTVATQSTSVSILPGKVWTILVYLDADNNLEADGIDDFNEMEWVGSNSNVDIIVLMDRIPNYDSSNGNWTEARIYHVEKDNNAGTINSTLLANLGEVNMGDPQVLENFIEYGVTAYPAEHYMIELWDHGSGWKSALASPPPLKSIAVDSSSNGDSLTNAELKQAFANALSDLGMTKFDILGMDACLMQMAEIDFYLQDYFDYVVASEETIPGWGWPYDKWLAYLVAAPTMTPDALGQAIAHSYYDDNSSNSTLSVVELSDMNVLAAAVDSFAGELIAARAAHSVDICATRYATLDFDDPDYIDLYHFASLISASPNLPAALKTAADSVTSSVSQAVTFNLTHIANAHGISIYFPLDSYNTNYNALDFSATTRWNEFISGLPCSP